MLGPVAILTVAITAVFVCLLMYAEFRDDARTRAIYKPLASAGFLAFAATQQLWASEGGRLVGIGLFCGFLGDLFLIPKSRRTFMLGVLAFLFGHCTYLAAFLHQGAALEETALAALAYLLFFSTFFVRLIRSLPSALRVPIVAYSVALASFAGASFSLSRTNLTPWLAVAGAAFLVSDLAVARHRFLVPEFRNKLFGLPLYYSAQLAIAFFASQF